MTWQSLLKNASLGLLTMAAVKFLQRGSEEERSGMEQVVDFALGATLAAAYSRLIPWEDWGIESGIAFAQLPMVASLAGLRPGERTRASLAGREMQMARQAAELALWGALTGTAMRYLGEAHEERRAIGAADKRY